jgi:DNA-binding GntR family transcriptional regulator
VAPHIAALLKIEPGSMVVNIERLFRLGSGKPIQLSLSMLPANQFRFSIKLKRNRTDV